MAEIAKLSFFESANLNLPKLSDIAPIFLPITWIEAPEMGSAELSTTTPVLTVLCALTTATISRLLKKIRTKIKKKHLVMG